MARLRGETLIAMLQRDGHSLKRVGAEYKMLCPFHADHKPSMCVNPVKAVLKCFSCGAGGDPLTYLMEFHHLTFVEALNFAADFLGLSATRTASKKGAGPAQREIIVQSAPYMSAIEVLAVQKSLRSKALAPKDWLGKLFNADLLDYAVDAMERIDGFVAPVMSIYSGVATPALVVAMRDENGALTSLRFRSFVRPTGGGRSKRWSIDVKEKQGDDWVQTKQSRSGLMMTWDFLNDEFCLDNIYTFWIEGETDLLAATILMLRDFGEDESQWPARWLALPGVNSCHDMALKTRLSQTVITFFDNDAAGLTTVFDHRRTKKEEDRMVLNMGEPPAPGLLSRLKYAKKRAGACFPQRRDGGKKYDLRDMVNDLLRWHDVRQHMLATMTTDVRGPLGWQRNLLTQSSPTSSAA